MKYYFLALGTLVVVCVGCSIDGQQIVDKGEHFAPPASMMERPGPMVDGPGPGVMPMMMAAPPQSFAATTSEVRFVGPSGMRVGWQIPAGYASNQLTAPQRYNFPQGATYRLKLSDIPNREGTVLYPTLQVYPTHPTTDAYLSHNSIPLELTDEDLDQVEANNFVTKVIYLPDAKFQELAIAGVETLVSTRLDPGVDPVEMAQRRGTIMAVLRVGNRDLEMPAATDDQAYGAPNGSIHQISHTQVDGDKGHRVPPMPVAHDAGNSMQVPGPMLMGMPGAPGAPANHMVSGAPGAPMWGMPLTGTPIGLPGPPHLPLGKPASLKSHTVRNLTKTELPEPVDHFLLDVKHKPGLSLPKPVEHVQYSETHPTYAPGKVSYPAWAAPQ